MNREVDCIEERRRRLRPRVIDLPPILSLSNHHLPIAVWPARSHSELNREKENTADMRLKLGIPRNNGKIKPSLVKDSRNGTLASYLSSSAIVRVRSQRSE